MVHKKCGRTDGQTDGRRQNYIPPTSSGDNKIIDLGHGNLETGTTREVEYFRVAS